MVCGRYYRLVFVVLVGLSVLAVATARSEEEPSPRQDRDNRTESRPAEDGPDMDRPPKAPGPGFGRRMHDRRSGPDRKPSERWGELERQKVRNFIDKHFPEAAKELRDRSEKNPQLGERILGSLMPEMTRLLRSYEEDPPELFNLRLESAKNEMAMRKLMREYRHAAEEDRDRIRGKMRNHVARDVELREDIGRQELRRLEEGVERLRGYLDDLEEKRDAIIEQELENRLKFRPPGRGPGRPDDAPRGPRGRRDRPEPPTSQPSDPSDESPG
ncbi:MAG: hypothetical protein JXB13_09120 [Phycisphaerae bacterium]|nr:hypothetical protein [Phycisphaerae bacterium]